VRKRTSMILGAAFVAAVSGGVLAEPQGQAGAKAPAEIAAAGEGEAVALTATVEKIDLKKRLVTLKGPEGNEVTVHAGPQVKNLAQVKKGDEVVVSYFESVAVDLRKPGEKASAGIVEAVATAKPGAMPGGVALKRVRVTATIAAIDAAKSVVTLKGPLGNQFPVKVKDAARLEALKIGDAVDVTYTEALAIDVKKPTAGQ